MPFAGRTPEISEVIIAFYRRKKINGKQDADLEGLPARIIEHCLSDEELAEENRFLLDVQQKAAQAILNCKSGKIGMNFSRCDDCGHISAHNNSCRNRNCPNCQAVSKELWVNKIISKVNDSPYFHVVFTLPHELASLIYCNQTLLYRLLQRCCSEILLELSADKKWLGVTPGIIQILHTWNQELDYHVHMHCIISGGGITGDFKLRKSKDKFFIPIFVLRDKFKGKYTTSLKKMYVENPFSFSKSCSHLQDSSEWQTFVVPFMKKTGVLTSKKPSTALKMPLNILENIPIRLPFPTDA